MLRNPSIPREIGQLRDTPLRYSPISDEIPGLRDSSLRTSPISDEIPDLRNVRWPLSGIPASRRASAEAVARCGDACVSA